MTTEYLNTKFHIVENWDDCGYRLVDVTGMGLSVEAETLYRALFRTGDGNMRSPSDYTIWMDCYLDNALSKHPYRGKRLSGLLSALRAKGLYSPTDGYAWGEIRVEEVE